MFISARNKYQLFFENPQNNTQSGWANYYNISRQRVHQLSLKYHLAPKQVLTCTDWARKIGKIEYLKDDFSKLTYAELNTKYNLSKSKLFKIIKLTKLKRIPQLKQYYRELVAHPKWRTKTEWAKYYNVKFFNVNSFVEHYGIEVKKKPCAKIKYKRIFKNPNLRTLTEWAKEYGVSMYTIQFLKRKYNLVFKKRYS